MNFHEQNVVTCSLIYLICFFTVSVIIIMLLFDHEYYLHPSQQFVSIMDITSHYNKLLYVLVAGPSSFLQLV